MRFLFVPLLVCNVFSVHADVVWPTVFIAARWVSIPVIVLGLLIEIGFVKYFTKVGWKRAIIVATVMNAASATVGTILTAVIGGIVGLSIMLSIDWGSIPYISVWGPFVFWLYGYIFAILMNIWIEGGIIQMMQKLPFSKTFHWLFFANAITVGMCMPAFALDSHSWLSITQAIAIPILVISVYSTYLVYRYRKSIFK
ncbi:MAG: hypothetical protein J5821_01230 [Alphaproteobacteria bacterium]|nr:hypothetical protein [Alphaproteobacteria bacterium]